MFPHMTRLVTPHDFELLMRSKAFFYNKKSAKINTITKEKERMSIFLNYDIRELVPLDMFGFMLTPKNIINYF